MRNLSVYLKAASIFLGIFSASAAFAGAVSGGGGGTLPADRVPDDQLVQAVIESRALIDVYLKPVETYSARTGDTGMESELVKVFFKEGVDVFRLLDQVKVYPNRYGPCHDGTDESSKEVDGSANTDIEGGICISIPRIREKLSFANYESEIDALILHELSHLVGENEERAVSIQRVAARVFSLTSAHEISSWNFRVSFWILDTVEGFTDSTRRSLESGAKISCDDLRKFENAYSLLYGEIANGSLGLMLTRELDTELVGQLRIRISAISAYLCSQPGFGDDYDQKYYAEKRKIVFGDSATVTAQEYWDRFFSTGPGSTINLFPRAPILIRNYSAMPEVLDDLARTSRDLEGFGERLEKDREENFRFKEFQL